MAIPLGVWYYWNRGLSGDSRVTAHALARAVCLPTLNCGPNGPIGRGDAG